MKWPLVRQQFPLKYKEATNDLGEDDNCSIILRTLRTHIHNESKLIHNINKSMNKTGMGKTCTQMLPLCNEDLRRPPMKVVVINDQLRGYELMIPKEV